MAIRASECERSSPCFFINSIHSCQEPIDDVWQFINSGDRPVTLDPRTQTWPGWPSSIPNPNTSASTPSERIFSHDQRLISESRTALNLDILADKLFFVAENWE
jgi:hypothetical protein